MFYKELPYRADPEFGSLVRDQLDSTKVVHVTGLEPSVNQRDFYERVCDRIGLPILADDDATTGAKNGGRWTDVQYNQDLETYFRHSKTAQPLHTDSSYEDVSHDVVMLYCCRQAPEGGESVFLDSIDLIYHLNAKQPALLDALQSTSLRFQKGATYKTRPVIGYDARGPVLTWNYYRARPERPHDKALVEGLHAFLSDYVVGGGRAFVRRLEPGEAVFFKDERLLHGRNAFTARSNGDRLFWKAAIRIR